MNGEILMRRSIRNLEMRVARLEKAVREGVIGDFKEVVNYIQKKTGVEIKLTPHLMTLYRRGIDFEYPDKLKVLGDISQNRKIKVYSPEEDDFFYLAWKHRYKKR